MDHAANTPCPPGAPGEPGLRGRLPRALPARPGEGAGGGWARVLGRALAEAAWPTRCAVCDAPGAVLCERCARELPHIDWWGACPRCGAPWGRVQCSECNDVVLAASGRDRLPYDQAASAVILDGAAHAVACVFKDQGEQRLAVPMARLMAACAPPAWSAPGAVVSFVPASAAALRRSGFDHGALLGQAVADELGVPCAALLARPRAADQRRLGRRERAANMAHSLEALPGAAARGPVILVDDVLTTGATLCAGADALRGAGAPAVYGLTFARA